MASALPLTKLASLLVKTLAKPLSKRIKHQFSRYDLTQRMLIGIGQTSHHITSRMTIWSAGYRVRRIAPLEEEKALSTGAEFVGESFIFLVSGWLVVWEYNRSNDKAKAKEAKRRQQATEERRALQAKLHALDVRVKALEQVTEKNSQSLLNIGQYRYQPPDANEVVPIDDDDDDDETSSSQSISDSARTETKAKGARWWPW